jgi:hypothetical protein
MKIRNLRTDILNMESYYVKKHTAKLVKLLFFYILFYSMSIYGVFLKDFFATDTIFSGIIKKLLTIKS